MFASDFPKHEVKACALCQTKDCTGAIAPCCKRLLCGACTQWCFFTHHTLSYPTAVDEAQKRRIDHINDMTRPSLFAKCPMCKRKVSSPLSKKKRQENAIQEDIWGWNRGAFYDRQNMPRNRYQSPDDGRGPGGKSHADVQRWNLPGGTRPMG